MCAEKRTWCDADRHQNTVPLDRFSLLSVRSSICLKADGLDTEEKVREWVVGGCLPSIFGMKRKDIREVRVWLGLDVTESAKKGAAD